VRINLSRFGMKTSVSRIHPPSIRRVFLDRVNDFENLESFESLSSSPHGFMERGGGERCGSESYPVSEEKSKKTILHPLDRLDSKQAEAVLEHSADALDKACAGALKLRGLGVHDGTVLVHSAKRLRELVGIASKDVG
jgi:hypothetical protein